MRCPVVIVVLLNVLIIFAFVQYHSSSSPIMKKVAEAAPPSTNINVLAKVSTPSSNESSLVVSFFPDPPNKLPLAAQIHMIESQLPKVYVEKYSKLTNYLRQLSASNINNSTTKALLLPVPSCLSPISSGIPKSIIYSEFCSPNTGQRFWAPPSATSATKVFPISYGIPKINFVPLQQAILKKTRACSVILPRVQSSRLTLKVNEFATQQEYYAAYTNSYYCVVSKKGGWDSLRLYEIIAAGCMPYFLDLEFCPDYSLFHVPKQILLEARDLPGVYFNCEKISVGIDFDQFPKEKYFVLLAKLNKYAKRYLTTCAIAKYVVEDVLSNNNKNNTNAIKKILFLQRKVPGAKAKGRGSYNSWLLLHGLREYFSLKNSSSPIVVDALPVQEFLYKDFEFRKMKNKDYEKSLYGRGFSYSFLMSDSNLEVKNLRRQVQVELSSKYIRQHTTINNNNLDPMSRFPALTQFDTIIYADPASLGASDGSLKFLTPEFFLNQTLFRKLKRVVILHASDVPMPTRYAANFDWMKIYHHELNNKNHKDADGRSQRSDGDHQPVELIVLQREIPDCRYDYYHRHHNGEKIGDAEKSEVMKKCLFYQTKNCNDDVFVMADWYTQGWDDFLKKRLVF